MTRYPYTGRDLLTEREPYSYSRCAEAGFIEAWRSARHEAVDRIRAGAGTQPPRAGDPADGLSLAGFLTSVTSDCPACGADAAYARIEPLVHKFEVFRRLFASYDASHRRRPSARPARLAEYLQFGECLATIGEGEG